ncbi:MULTISPECIES: ABC transporter permease [Parafrankia]|uniref:ABC transporter permease n=1 Tax=Parafrankia TaxID=2994362 RepID=UPI001F613DA7|nr:MULTISPECIES: ABC transporter permease [Parafrankia]
MLQPARLGVADTLRTGSAGLRSRPLRVGLAALGIALGVAALVAVLGVSSSSRADLDRQLAALGTNLLTVEPGQTALGGKARLPTESIRMAARIGPVSSVSATGRINAAIYRNDHVDAGNTSAIAVLAAQPGLPVAVGGAMAEGRWLDQGTSKVPAVVLGSRAATKLAIHQAGLRVWLGGQWFGVLGVLEPVPLAPELDNAALVGWGAAETYLGFDGHPTMLYTRSAEPQVEAVRTVLPASVNPQNPYEVRVSRPSDALAAQRATRHTLDRLLLGLGAVALVVGGVGVANTMVISVLERRGEIGLRRALGATRGQIRLQFLTESLLLAALGGLGGVLLGSLATAGYAATQHWPVAIPLVAWLGGLVVTLPIGVVAGIYPAIRAARLTPVSALNTP